jgi:hypothetical protein
VSFLLWVTKRGPFEGEDEIVGHLGGPALEIFGPLQRIEGAVDLNRPERRAGESEFLPLRQLWRVEHAAPATVAPARNADADVADVAHGVCNAAVRRVIQHSPCRCRSCFAG